MLERTCLDAESHLRDVNFNEIVNSNPLMRSLIFAALAVASVAVLAISKPAVLQTAAQRLYLLDEKVWPRRCRIELIGVKVNREEPVEGIDEIGQFVSPLDGEFRIAKGSALTVVVRALEGTDGDEFQLPESCSLIYNAGDGRQGLQVFKKIGAPRDGFQVFSLDGPPLSGILNDMTFEILGGDYRLGPFKICVVDEPSVMETRLALRYPAYMVDETSGSWTDRTIQWTGQARLPVGTAVTVLAKSSKNLTKVYAFDRTDESMQVIEARGHEFQYEIPRLENSISVQFYLCDTDGLVSDQPHAVHVDTMEDQPPVVQIRLSGVGTAVTPDVQIPVSGSVTDDYGLARTWVEIKIADSPAVAEIVSIGSDAELDVVLDFKQRRQEFGEQYELPVGDGNKVQLVVKSQDRCDLHESLNVGIGDRYALDIVAPNQLLMILERLEVGQRQRLEQIYLELTDAKNYLVRTKSGRLTNQDHWVEPGDEDQFSEPGDERTVDQGPEVIRKQELRLLFSQRANLQVDKSTQEIMGSAQAFDNIRLQLINNRIDSEDRKNRISDQIIAPLRLIGGRSMRQLNQSIEELESSLRELQISPRDEGVAQAVNQQATAAIEQLDVALYQLDLVLDALVKYETQNELLEVVRQMIKIQKDLMDRTRRERQRKAFEGLLD